MLNTKQFFLGLFLFFLCSFSWAQEGTNVNRNNDEKKIFESGQSLFDDRLYELAYERFSLLSKKHPDDSYVKYLAGVCCIFISDKHLVVFPSYHIFLFVRVYQMHNKTPILRFCFRLCKFLFL